ncbi:MAG: hypothetical protein ABIQ95_00100, partial [Bdellovibrionia bacterium]
MKMECKIKSSLVFLLVGLMGCSNQASEEGGGKSWYGRMQISAAFARILGRDHCKEGDDHKNAERLENKLSSCNFTDNQLISAVVYQRCLTDSFKFFEAIKSKECREKYVPEIRSTLRNLAVSAIESSLIAGVQASNGRELTQNSALSPKVAQDLWTTTYKDPFRKALGFMNQWVVETRSHLYRTKATVDIFYRSASDQTLLNPEVSFLADMNYLSITFWGRISEIMEKMEQAKYFKVTSDDLSADNKGKSSSFEFLVNALEVVNQQAIELNVDPELRAQLLALELKEIYPRVKIFAELHDFSQEILNSENVLRNNNHTSNVALGILSLAGIDFCLNDSACSRHR